MDSRVDITVQSSLNQSFVFGWKPENLRQKRQELDLSLRLRYWVKGNTRRHWLVLRCLYQAVIMLSFFFIFNSYYRPLICWGSLTVILVLVVTSSGTCWPSDLLTSSWTSVSGNLKSAQTRERRSIKRKPEPCDLSDILVGTEPCQSDHRYLQSCN